MIHLKNIHFEKLLLAQRYETLYVIIGHELRRKRIILIANRFPIVRPSTTSQRLQLITNVSLTAPGRRKKGIFVRPFEQRNRRKTGGTATVALRLGGSIGIKYQDISSIRVRLSFEPRSDHSAGWSVAIRTPEPSAIDSSRFLFTRILRLPFSGRSLALTIHPHVVPPTRPTCVLSGIVSQNTGRGRRAV
ncbi:hypothetical protein Trydic_g7188 [Trypoxylus dichotomus]